MKSEVKNIPTIYGAEETRRKPLQDEQTEDGYQKYQFYKSLDS